MSRDFSRDLRLLSALARLLPDFLIPGEAKCGTTSLYNHLIAHPEIAPCRVKEPRSLLAYGASPILCRADYPLRLSRFLAALRGKKLLTGEATAEYFSSHEVPAAAARVVPRARVIVLLRNPVTRAISDYAMFRRNGLVDEDFTTAVRRAMNWIGEETLAPLVEGASLREHNPVRFIHRGMYLAPLKRWKKLFPGLMIVRSEDLFTRTAETVADVCSYLGLDPPGALEERAWRRGDSRPDVPAELLREMGDFFASRNRQLYDYIGRDMGWEEETESLAGGTGRSGTGK